MTYTMCVRQFSQTQSNFVGRKGPLVGGCLVYYPSSSRAMWHHLPRAMSRTLKIFKEGDSSASLGSLCQCSFTFTVKNISRYSERISKYFSLFTFPPLLSLGANEKSLTPLSLHPHFLFFSLYIDRASFGAFFSLE